MPEEGNWTGQIIPNLMAEEEAIPEAKRRSREATRVRKMAAAELKRSARAAKRALNQSKQQKK